MKFLISRLLKKNYSRVRINAGRYVKEKKYWKRKGEAVIINY